MSTEDKANLLMLCGALHDVAENTKEQITSTQILDIEQKIEKLVLNSIIGDLQQEKIIVSELLTHLPT